MFSRVFPFRHVAKNRHTSNTSLIGLLSGLELTLFKLTYIVKGSVSMSEVERLSISFLSMTEPAL